ncbi:MAG: hypothetical protein QM831_01000 [Kofleriaceae bacterium]
MRRVLTASCLLWLTAAPIAHADPAVAGAGSAAATEDSMLATIPEKARLLADRGRQLQREGKFGDALEAYKAAYVLAPSPGLLFNLAQAYRLNGDCDDAAWMYRRFLETEPREDLRQLALDHIQKLSSCAHTGFRTPEPDVNGVPNAKRPVQPKTQPAATTSSPTADLVDDDPGKTKRKVGVGLMIGGGALIVASVGFAIDGHFAANDVSDAYKGGVRDPDVHSLDDRGQRDQTISWVTGVTGGAALISGAVLYGLGRRASDHVAIVPRSGGGEVRLAWQF